MSRSRKIAPEKFAEIWLVVFGLIGIVHASFLSSLLDKKLSQDAFDLGDGMKMILAGVFASLFVMILATHAVPANGWRAQTSRWFTVILAMALAIGAVGAFTELWGKTIATFVSWLFSTEFFLAFGRDAVEQLEQGND